MNRFSVLTLVNHTQTEK